MFEVKIGDWRIELVDRYEYVLSNGSVERRFTYDELDQLRRLMQAVIVLEHQGPCSVAAT